MKAIYQLVILLISLGITYADTRTDNLPQNFKWRYTMDDREPSPRTGQFWRDGIFLDGKIVVLNSHYLIGLDMNGKQLWINALPAEEAFSEAKMHPVAEHEIVIVTSDSLLRIDIRTGELLQSYNYKVAKRSAFQMTELMPRHSVVMDEYLYVFLGPQLLSFHTNSLERADVLNLTSAPKTIPMLINNLILVGLQNKTLLMVDPMTKNSNILLNSFDRRFNTLRQPVTNKETIYVPTDRGIHVFEFQEEINQSNKFTDAILDFLNGKLWMRKHKTGTLQELDPITLESRQELTYEEPKFADEINTPLVGQDNLLLHIDSIKGQIITFDTSSTSMKVEAELFVEDLSDSPPLQFLAQKDNLILIGAFDGLYLSVIQ
ncbi:MAG: hypothetical protein ACRCS8_01565 [Brevinema sp.]